MCDFVRTLDRQAGRQADRQTDRQTNETLPQKAPDSWNKVDSGCNKPLCSDVAGVQRMLDPNIGNFVITSIV